ncbi:MAG: type II secretion system F family protein [Candidatus Omnitrophica bacterium]|nr:type II secretion system F family protein [Candidatus Omnitrophota bacterium]
MPTFKYVVKNQEGKKIEQVAENEDFSQLVNKLRNQNFTIISIDEVKGKVKKGGGQSGRGGRVKDEDLIIFSRQLATLLDAGVTLVQALSILCEQIENQNFKQIISDLGQDIQGGKSFSDALLKHPRFFSSLFVNMIKAGEKSGRLPETLDRLSNYLEKANALLKKVKSALAYPTVVSSMAVLITLFLLIKVIPTFKGIFESLGGTLPLPTLILINISDFVRDYFLIVGFVLIFSVILLKYYAKTEKGSFTVDKMKLKLPVFGALLRKVAISRFCSTFSSLIESGVSVLDCLTIVGKTSGNKVIEKIAEDVQGSVRQGENINTPLGKSGVFPPLVTRMIAVGEQSGELAKMLSKVADFYEREVDAAVSGLTSLIEPLIIAFLGIVIGSIAVAMLLPIFKISTLISG